MKNLLLLISLFLLIACHQPIDTSNLKIAIPKQLAYQSTINTPNHLVNLELFHYENNQWKTLQTIDSIKSRFGNDSLEIMDFNFDGTEDFRIFIGTASRGANEYYEVFIQNPRTKQFTALKQDYIPNIQPDDSSKLILGVRYFSHKTIFEYYKIQSDTLALKKQIEVVENGDWTNRYYETYDDFGAIISTKIDSVKDFGESIFSIEPLND